MKKLYQIRVTFDTGRVIRGPVFNSDNYEDFKKFISNYDEISLLKLTDGFRRISIPQEMVKRSYIELRRISYLRAFLRSLFRLVTK